jgi:hypothetical protein
MFSIADPLKTANFKRKIAQFYVASPQSFLSREMNFSHAAFRARGENVLWDLERAGVKKLAGSGQTHGGHTQPAS